MKKSYAKFFEREKELYPEKFDHELLTLEYLATNIRCYGNTVLSENPQKYMERLSDAGLECYYRPVRDNTPRFIDNRINIEGEPLFYVVEEINNHGIAPSIYEEIYY